MKCMKCNHALPDDSEFCQYCGNRIEKTAQMPVKDAVMATARVETPTQKTEEAPKPRPGVRVQEQIGTMNADCQMQPDHKSERDFGCVPKKAPKAKKVKQPKKKYCSRCGELIDSQSKQCTGCGKKYFKGIKVNKFAVTITALTLVIAALIGLIVVQYQNYSGLNKELHKSNVKIENLEVANENLEEKNEDLKEKNEDLEGEVERLSQKVFDQGLTLNQQSQSIEYMEEQHDKNSEVVLFCKNYVEIIADDGTNIYHKYGCIYLDISDGFLVLNTVAAEYDGYSRCPYCHYQLN